MAEPSTEQRNQPAVVSLPVGERGAGRVVVPQLLKIFLNAKPTQPAKPQCHFLATSTQWSGKKC